MSHKLPKHQEELMTLLQLLAFHSNSPKLKLINDSLFHALLVTRDKMCQLDSRHLNKPNPLMLQKT